MKVNEIVNGWEDPVGYWVDGHHEAQRFVKALEGYDLATLGTPMKHDASRVVHRHMAVSPIRPEEPDSDLVLNFSKEPGEETIPVTVIFESE